MEFVEAHGARIPIVGFGSMRLKDDAGAQAIESAIRQGYRHIDTAAFYGNEGEVGRAIKASGVKREDIFLTTKIFPGDFEPDALKAAAESFRGKPPIEYHEADVADRQLPLMRGLPFPPDLVTCAIGANDIVRRVPVPELESRLRAIIARLPERAIIATLPQGLGPERTETVNRVIRTEAPAAGLVVADVWARTGPPWHGKYAEDRFHPGVLGYADWAAAFADVLHLALPAP